jgi:large subunit ribosomal protein L9
MRVVFLEDVAGVAEGGDVKVVKGGFARNYLIPQNLAVPATHNALQRVERLAKEAEVTRLKRLEDMKALAAELDGVHVNVEMRAGSGGRLYGSVTNMIVADELSKLTEREIDRRTIELEEPIRELGFSDVAVNLHPEVEAKISLLVYAMGEDPEALRKAAEERETEVEEEEEEADTEKEQPAAEEPESALAIEKAPTKAESPESESEPEKDP